MIHFVGFQSIESFNHQSNNARKEYIRLPALFPLSLSLSLSLSFSLFPLSGRSIQGVKVAVLSSIALNFEGKKVDKKGPIL